MRRKRRRAIYVQAIKSREELQRTFGRAWDTAELARDFIVTAIISPDVVVVRRKADDAVDTLQYQRGPPCLYFNFTQQQPNGQ